MMTFLSNLKLLFTRRAATLFAEVDSLFEQHSDQNRSIHEAKETLDTCLKSINKLQSEVMQLNQKGEALAQQLNVFEKYRADIEVQQQRMKDRFQVLEQSLQTNRTSMQRALDENEKRFSQHLNEVRKAGNDHVDNLVARIASIDDLMNEIRVDLNAQQEKLVSLSKISEKSVLLSRSSESNPEENKTELANIRDTGAAIVSANESLEALKKETGIFHRKFKHLHEDVGFLYRTVFGEEQWLADAKDMHKGERCFLLGCGPSINQIDHTLLKNEFTMGVNGICLLEGLNLDYFVSVSHHWWQNYKDEIIALPCRRKFFPEYLPELFAGTTPVSELRTISKINHVRYNVSSPLFFSRQADKYVTLGGTVITVCLQLLFHLGFDEVILLGVDHNYDLTNEQGRSENMVSSDNLPHFVDGYYRQPTDVHVDLEAMERGYRLADEVYRSAGRRILNASPGTKLDIFETADLTSLIHNG